MSDFIDRKDAGRRLGALLVGGRRAGALGADLVVLGLPRGGVPVAAEVARMLDAPLDVVLVRKLGLPFASEVAMGAIAEGGIRVLDDGLIARYRVTDADLARVERRERERLAQRTAVVRDAHPPRDLSGCTAVIVDDGIATGSTARAACRAARNRGAITVLLAAPVAAPDALARVTEADEIVCVLTPADFRAVGAYYADFAQTSDAEVLTALARTGDH